MTSDQGLGLLREFGFPVFVACWFMWRMERRLDRLYELMNSLMQATALLAKSVDSIDDHIVATPPRNQTGAVPALQEGKTK